MPIALKENDVVAGKIGTYRVVDGDPKIGGQARGYLVENVEDGKPLFLKMFTEPTALSEDAEEFRQRQATLVQRLEAIPDFVCRDIEFFEARRTFYKVSERIQGETLQEKLDKASAASSRDFWSQDDRQINSAVISYALSQLHEQRIAHLDLKPDNILLQERTIESTGATVRVAKLLDFDGAYVEGAPRSAVMGTELYFSPEHQRPEEYGEANYPADVFQLGIILYQLLARRYPFDDKEGMYQHQVLHPSDVWPALPRSVGDALWAALSPRPEDRPTAKALHAALVNTASPAPEPIEETTDAPPLTRLALLVGPRRFRFWKDSLLTRSALRGVPGYEFMHDPQARIFPCAGGWCISHVSGATNQTRVNGRALAPGEVRSLVAGDEVSVGPVLKLSVTFEPME
jgi:serine/threonine protein kinase